MGKGNRKLVSHGTVLSEQDSGTNNNTNEDINENNNITNSIKNKNVNNKNVNNNKNDNKYSDKYIEILDLYARNLNSVYNCNKVLKSIFFSVTMAVLVALIAIFGFIIVRIMLFFTSESVSEKNSQLLEIEIGTISSVAASLTTVVVALIKIPKIIAKYLFNPNEENSMEITIKNIQDYEVQIKQLEQQAESRLAQKISEKPKEVKEDKQICNSSFAMPKDMNENEVVKS